MTQWAQPGADALLAGGTMPTTFYVARHTANPGDDGTLNPATDTRRIAVTMDTPVNGVALNATYGEILNATTTEDITHISLWDSSSGGVCWFIDALGSTLNITATETVAIAIGQLSITLNLWV